MTVRASGCPAHRRVPRPVPEGGTKGGPRCTPPPSPGLTAASRRGRAVLLPALQSDFLRPKRRTPGLESPERSRRSARRLPSSRSATMSSGCRGAPTRRTSARRNGRPAQSRPAELRRSCGGDRRAIIALACLGKAQPLEGAEHRRHGASGSIRHGRGAASEVLRRPGYCRVQRDERRPREVARRRFRHRLRARRLHEERQDV